MDEKKGCRIVIKREGAEDCCVAADDCKVIVVRCGDADSGDVEVECCPSDDK